MLVPVVAWKLSPVRYWFHASWMSSMMRYGAMKAAAIAAVVALALYALKPEFHGLVLIVAAYAFLRTQFSLIDARERGRTDCERQENGTIRI